MLVIVLTKQLGYKGAESVPPLLTLFDHRLVIDGPGQCYRANRRATERTENSCYGGSSPEVRHRHPPLTSRRLFEPIDFRLHGREVCEPPDPCGSRW